MKPISLLIIVFLFLMTLSSCAGNAILKATKDGRSRVVKELLADGADVDAKDNAGNTALILASLFGYPDIVNELLSKGADVNAKNKYGVTPLIVASTLGHFNIVKELLAKGADPNAKSKDGSTALMGASYYTRDIGDRISNDFLYKVYKGGGDMWKSLQLISSATNDSGHSNIIKELLAKGADVNAKDYNGVTALMAASYIGEIDRVKELLAKGADMNEKDNAGNTALMRAKEGGHKEMVELLEKAGAK